MNIARIILSCLAAALLGSRLFAGSEAKVAIPAYDDKYTKLARQLEAGETGIDYTEFRHSFLESEQFKVIGNQKPDLKTLRTTLREVMKKSNYDEIVAV